MQFDRNFKKYHESISGELEAVQDRIRNLIGDAHWQSDGEHKESVLRKVLRSCLPETLRVGSGFVCCLEDNSTQIDIIISDATHPVLFKNGDFSIVTSDVVKSIIEVKTKIRSSSDLRKVLKGLADNGERIRREANPGCRVGLFVYSDESVCDEDVLIALKETATTDFCERRAIDWISIGKDRFFRYWRSGSKHAKNENDGTAWRSYHLRRLAQAYFISNVVWETSPEMPHHIEPFWFPIEGGKEQYCTYEIRSKSSDRSQPVQSSRNRVAVNR